MSDSMSQSSDTTFRDKVEALREKALKASKKCSRIDYIDFMFAAVSPAFIVELCDRVLEAEGGK